MQAIGPTPPRLHSRGPNSPLDAESVVRVAAPSTGLHLLRSHLRQPRRRFSSASASASAGFQPPYAKSGAAPNVSNRRHSCSAGSPPHPEAGSLQSEEVMTC
ncbi:hypothetical protein SEVIR_9G273901v4 [Setaria viridis]